MPVERIQEEKMNLSHIFSFSYSKLSMVSYAAGLLKAALTYLTPRSPWSVGCDQMLPSVFEARSRVISMKSATTREISQVSETILDAKPLHKLLSVSWCITGRQHLQMLFLNNLHVARSCPP